MSDSETVIDVGSIVGEDFRLGAGSLSERMLKKVHQERHSMMTIGDEKCG